MPANACSVNNSYYPFTLSYNVNMITITFSQNLRELMRVGEISQVKLSKEIKVSQSAISAWLLGKKEPSIASLWALADYFDCSIDELVGRKL